MINWEDTSTHSRNDKVREPNSYSWKLNKLKVSIHRHIHYPKDQWLCSCYLLNLDKVELMNKDTEKAQNEALNLVRNTLLEYSMLLKLFDSKFK